MTCKQVIDYLADYTAGSLPALEQAAFDRHLAECPPCVAYLQNYRATIRLGHAAYPDSDVAVAERVPEELIRAILASQRDAGGGRA